MGKINLIDQLRKRDLGGGAAKPKKSIFDMLQGSASTSTEVEFEDDDAGSSLDPYEKRRVVMLLVGIMLVFGGRQLVPLFTMEMETAVRNEISDLDSATAVQQKRAKELQLVQEEMVQYESRVGDLNAKLQKIRQLNEERNLLVRMTDYIIKEMPARVWFDSIDIDTRTKVSISGFSTNYQLVSDFMKRLEGAVYFPKWRLVQTESKSTAESDTATVGAPIPLDSKKFLLEAETTRL